MVKSIKHFDWKGHCIFNNGQRNSQHLEPEESFDACPVLRPITSANRSASYSTCDADNLLAVPKRKVSALTWCMQVVRWLHINCCFVDSTFLIQDYVTDWPNYAFSHILPKHFAISFRTLHMWQRPCCTLAPSLSNSKCLYALCGNEPSKGFETMVA